MPFDMSFSESHNTARPLCSGCSEHLEVFPSDHPEQLNATCITYWNAIPLYETYITLRNHHVKIFYIQFAVL
jgi:hypothetical protein